MGLKVKTIRQSVYFEATPSEIYELLMISKKHAAFSGEPAKISTKVGGNFSAYGDYVTGKNIELFKGKKIVQLWRGSDWPEGHFSTATWTFRLPEGGGCTMDFVQEGVPVEHFESISQGWHEHYWDLMQAYLKKHGEEA